LHGGGPGEDGEGLPMAADELDEACKGLCVGAAFTATAAAKQETHELAVDMNAMD